MMDDSEVNTGTEAEAVDLEQLVVDLRAAIAIYDHALALVGNVQTNPEGWATDQQIANFYQPQARALAGEIQPIKQERRKARERA